MNLAQLLQQHPTPVSQWKPPIDLEWKPRKSDAKRKVTHLEKIERCFEMLTKPMTHREMAKITGYSDEASYQYMKNLFDDGRVRRSAKAPFIYWKM